MCYKNYTQHSGCGHYGPIDKNPYTPCEPAFSRLLASRGPSSPPLSPPTEFFPTRSNTTSTKRSSTSKRFFSLTGALHRSSTTTSTNTASSTASSRRAMSGPDGPSTSSTSAWSVSKPSAEPNPHNIPPHELAAAASDCPSLRSRTLVSDPGSAGRVCAECARWLDAMRSMVAGYDKGRGIKGTPAFKEFLQERDECVKVAVELGFAVPTARQARGIMGGFGSGRRSPSEGWTGSESEDGSVGFGRELVGWRG